MEENEEIRRVIEGFEELKLDNVHSLSIIVLGASGDLAKKKTFPALFALFRGGLLPHSANIVGYARQKMDHDEFRKHLVQYIKVDGEGKTQLESFKSLCYYFSTPDYGSESAFKQLAEELLKKIEKSRQGANRLFYLALPPSVFVDASNAIKKGAISPNGWNRIIVEKPFGHDLESARQLTKSLGDLFEESQLFRIDHYLGKEMVQNIMVLRFANSVYEPIWNRNHINNVKIVFKEDFGTEGRAGYFDQIGIIRDVMQNHLMQILTLIAMEPPVDLSSENIRDEKVKVLRYMPEIIPEDVVVGQYVADKSGKHKGYLDDDTVEKDSVTPTFALAVLWINNPRWEGVPFFLKTAKAVEEKKAEIRVQFKKLPASLFKHVAASNELVIRVQPDEAIYLKMNNKTPGLSDKLVISDLDMTYHSKFQDRYTPDAYERLILEAIRGDRNLFVRNDELTESWRIFTPLLHYLEKNKIKPISYEYGSRGPPEADEKTKQHGFEPVFYQWQKSK